MKTRKASRRLAKTSLDIEARLTELETNMSYVREQVSNHIPTALAELSTSIGRIEKRGIELDAVAKFSSVILKGIASVVTLLWGAKNIFPRLFHE